MRRFWLGALVAIVIGCSIGASTISEQYGAAAWRILKVMTGGASCAPGSYCMWGGGVYYADSIAGAQSALDSGCGSDLTTNTPTGCRVRLSGGIIGNGGATLHLAGTGSTATGRSGVVLECTGGGTARGVAGEPVSGTVIKSEGAVPIIDVGVCLGCMIQDCTLAGEDSATAGIDILSPGGTDPTTRLVVRNVSMYEINGYCLRTGTTGQVDTMLFENVSCRDSDGAYQQRDSQTVGVVLTNFDANMSGTASGPLFDIQEGDFMLVRSYVGIKNNETMVKLGTNASRVYIDGNQLEFGSSTSAVMFDFDEGSTTTENNMTISNNHIVFAQNGNTLFDVQRRGTLTISTNSIQDITGGKTISSDIMVDNSSSQNRLYVNLIGNVKTGTTGGDDKPLRWLPTLSPNPTHSVLPTLTSMVLSNTDSAKVQNCLDGEVFNDSDAAASTGVTRFKTCVGGAWVAP